MYVRVSILQEAYENLISWGIRRCGGRGGDGLKGMSKGAKLMGREGRGKS